MLNVAHMLGMVGNAIGEQNQQFDEEIDVSSDDDVEREDEEPVDGDRGDPWKLLQKLILLLILLLLCITITIYNDCK